VYIIINKKQLIAYTFNILDQNKTGKITATELPILVHAVYGSKVSKGDSGSIVTTNKTAIDTVKQVMTNLDVMKRGHISQKDFELGLNKHANLLSPAFTTQNLLREAIGGKRKWEEEANRVANYCNSKKISPQDVYTEAASNLPKSTPTVPKRQSKTKKRGSVVPINKEDDQ